MTSREPCEALLVDLDGVLRLFDPDHVVAVERRHGLPAGSIERTAFAWDRLRPVITGKITHQEWLDRIAEALDAPDAVAEWASHRGSVNPDVLELVRTLRAQGVPVGIATNSTDWLDRDLDQLGLRDEVDVVVNSSVVGQHKPTREFFAAACEAIGFPADRCLFIDDEHRHVEGARVAGLAALRYSGPEALRYVQAAIRIRV